MTPPTKADLKALHADAKVWAGGQGSVAETLDTTSHTAGYMELPFAKGLDYFGKEFVHNVMAAQNKVSDLLSQGADACHGISRTLIKVATAYENDETANQAELYKAWQGK